ncbi:MAG: hypothetical protein EZS28_036974 [Streblomastix strix]|uniref:HAT C-terminal dimerisation domain-containing protein n=1 Tax=Streblomastix strix TaxID=222440 RepID=A0A5J4UAJ7_9EUKA|nr:MAG: hypothetical protein EZS28_036974 [Streblomastix strix]
MCLGKTLKDIPPSEKLRFVHEVLKEANIYLGQYDIKNIPHNISMHFGTSQFWKDYQKIEKESSKILGEFSTRLNETVPTKANCERIFSRARWIEGKRRKRLKLKRFIAIIRIGSK